MREGEEKGEFGNGRGWGQEGGTGGKGVGGSSRLLDVSALTLNSPNCMWRVDSEISPTALLLCRQIVCGK